MRLLWRFVGKIAVNAAALWIGARFISGFEIVPRTFPYLDLIRNLSPFGQTLITGGIVLALLNIFLRPLLKIVSFPFLLLTFGLFNIVINLVILYVADWYVAELAIHGFKSLLLGSILIGALNSVI